MAGNAAGVRKAAAKRIGITLDEYEARQILNQKWCTRCKSWHHNSFFTLDRSRSDGLKSSCCDNSIRLKTPEELRSMQNATYRRYYAGSGKDRIKATKYARKRQLEIVPPEGRSALWERFDGQCAYCDEPATTLDHLIPVFKGGRSIRGNLVPSCKSCNSRKNVKDWERFVQKEAKNPKLELILEELVMEHHLGAP